MGDAAVADEGDWYAALAAGEDVGDWLDTLANAGRSAGRRERAARALAAKVAADATYAEEAREARATLALEKTLAALDASPGPEAAPLASLRAALELALAACASSGTGETLRDVAFAHHGVVRVRELALGRGVGAKLWNAALMLANDLDEHPDWCRGKRVL